MSLAAATRSELTKQFTTSAWWILGLVLALYLAANAGGLGAVLALGATGELPGSRPLPIAEDAIAPLLYSLASGMGYVFPLLWGTLMVTSEFRHRLLTPTFLATPRRGTVLTAKMIIGVVMGVFFGVLAIVFTVGAAAGVMSILGVDPLLASGDTWALLGRVLLAFVLWTLIGIGVGAIVRNQVAGVILVIAFTQLVEPVLRVIGGFVDQLKNVVEYLPGGASDALVGSSFLSLAGGSTSSTLPWWGGALVLAGYAAVFAVLGMLTSWRRDVD